MSSDLNKYYSHISILYTVYEDLNRIFFVQYIRTRDGSVGVEAGYGLDYRGSNSDKGKKLFSTAQSFLSNGYRR
jgi:hypothetical protein